MQISRRKRAKGALRGGGEEVSNGVDPGGGGSTHAG